MVIFFRNQKILLKKGSGKGLWPGLWGFFDSHELPEDALHQTLRELNLRMESVSFLESFRHQLSHINYLVQPVKVHVSPPSAQAESSGIKWINLADFSQLPISVPVRKIIDSLR
jgi:adenine-specific DNA glycosylase